MDNSGIVQKTVLRGCFERKIDRYKTYAFEMVAMATSCTKFARKNDFSITNM